jgi:hypothetical protein
MRGMKREREEDQADRVREGIGGSGGERRKQHKTCVNSS